MTGPASSADPCLEAFNAKDYERVVSVCSDRMSAESRPDRLADYHVMRGIAYRHKKEYDRAVTDLSGAIALFPDHAFAFFSRGQVLMLMGASDPALEDFAKVISLRRSSELSAAAYFHRGVVFGQRRLYEDAIREYSAAISGNPALHLVYINRGDIYSVMRHLDNAVTDYTSAIALYSGDVQTHIKRGAVLSEQGRYETAISDFTNAVRLDPKSSDAYFLRGNTYQLLGRYEEAISDYSRTLQLAPEHAGALLNRGRAYAEENKTGPAVEDLSAAIRADRRFRDAYLERGKIMHAERKFTDAVSDFSKAIELSPEDAEAYNRRGNAYAGARQYDLAADDFGKVLDLDPSKTGFFDPNIGIPILTKIIEKSPGHRAALIMRARNYIKRGLYKYAVSDYSKALSSAAHDSRILFERGKAYFMAGDFEAAIVDLGYAFELNPDDEALFWRGAAHRARRRYKEAYSDFIAAAELAPEKEEHYLFSVIVSHQLPPGPDRIAASKLRSAFDGRPADEWPASVAMYFLGKEGHTEEKVLALAGKGRNEEEVKTRLCEAYYYLGEKRLASGNGPRAIEYFSLAVETEAKESPSYFFAQALLGLLKSGRL